MSIWYALSAFGLILAATVLLYFGLVNAMYQEDVEDLSDYANNARLLLHQTGSPEPATAMTASAGHSEIALRVLDRTGKVLAETPGMAGEIARPTARDLAAVAAIGATTRDLVTRSGKPFLLLLESVATDTAGSPLYLQVSMMRDHDEELAERYRQRLGMVLGVALVICSIVGYAIAHSGVRPIKRISAAAARIGSRTLHERIATDRLPAELAELSTTFNSMLDRLEDSFRHISQFSDDVAHELRTPINNLGGEIEVALHKGRTESEYRDILASCLEECRRIARVIQTLLFLARSDGAEKLQCDTLDVDEELATVAAYYDAAAAEAGIALVAAPSGTQARLDRLLFRQAVGNLISNAIAHTPRGGSITIMAAAESGRVVIRVADTGCGIAAEHLPRVFERFYRIDPARTRSSENAGLGLAVVKSIVERHGGSVEIASVVGQGTEVRLAFPI